MICHGQNGGHKTGTGPFLLEEKYYSFQDSLLNEE